MEIQSLISEETKMGKSIVAIKANEQADENAFQTIVYAKPSFIPPITASEVNGERIFSYDVSADGFKSINSLNLQLTPTDFLLLMKNLTGVVSQSRDYMLDPFNFLLSEKYLYINPDNCVIRVIYLPLSYTVYSEAEISKQVYSLARSLSRRFSADDVSSQWQSIISHLWKMPESITVYEAHDLYSRLHNEYKGNEKKATIFSSPSRSLNTPTKPSNPVAESKLSKKEQEKVEETPKNKAEKPKNKGLFSGEKSAQKSSVFGSEKSTSKSSVFGSEKSASKSSIFGSKNANEPKKEKTKKGFLGLGGEKKPKPLKQKKNIFNKSVLGDDDLTVPKINDDDLETSIPDDDDVGNNAVVHVLEQGAKTTMIPINKSIFVFGRNGTKVDFCVEGDKSVSRVHMQISLINGMYYITDVNSKYGTTLDGEIITKDIPQKLSHGSIIKLGLGGTELLFELT